MPGRLEGKVAIVTGSASGIGRATAKLLAAEGAKVIVADVNKTKGAAVAAEIGNNAQFVRTDVADEANVKDCVDRAIAAFGQLDCLVNGAAGTSVLGPIEEVELKAHKAAMDILFNGPFLGIKHAVPHFKKQGHGCVINILSLAAIAGVGSSVTYTAAKHGLLGLTRAAADQLGPFNIRVNAVAPGWIVTPMHARGFEDPDADDETRDRILRTRFKKKQPLPRAGDPRDIAEAVAYLASDGAKFVTGQTIVVDGGLSAVTRAFDEIGPLKS